MSSSITTSSRQSPKIPFFNDTRTAMDEACKPQTMETSIERLDHIYDLVRRLITDYQSVTTGLFPRYSIDQNVGHAKDSIYCALACWACSIAYKRLDDNRGRETELCQTAVKTMRGIMFCWMRQIDKLNAFKQNNAPEFALHARFDLHTGAEITTSPYPHLQMDLIALYLLVLVEMTVAGAQIVYTSHEVAFLQNLVFYIERTYRTPDFGIWERGTRYNQGKTELHASSLGLVKAALESINGFNCYGLKGNSDSVIYVDIDGHNRNRTTFETLLPRESNSKNTDAALLLTTGWPAFATHDERLIEQTLNKCQRYLEGRFGLKRFLRDGFRTELEDQTRRFYEDEETVEFNKIESQFPMFLACIAITAHFKGNNSLADRYWMKFQELLVPLDSESSCFLCPECYCIDEEHMAEERKTSHSQKFYPLSHEEFGHHLWSNSIYLIGTLLREKLIHLSDIDPIYRHLPASERPKYVPINRSSAFQGGMEGNPVVQVALISESSQLQMMLSTYGISTQTPHEVEPIQIWPSWRMVKLFEQLGRDKKLGLDGRPSRPLGPLNTSKIFRVCGDTVILYPLVFELKDFYTNADPSTLIDDIKRDLEFVAKRWKLAGRPTFCILLREENVAGEYFENMLDLLVNLKNGFVGGVRVRLGRIHQLINTGCIEHIDMVDPTEVDFDVDILTEIDAREAQIKARSNLRAAPPEDAGLTNESEFEGKDDQTLYQIIVKHDVDSLRRVAFAIAAMQKRYSGAFVVQGETLTSRLERIYRQACQWQNHWWLVRFCAAKLRKTINSLAPSITNLLVRGKQVIIGHKSCREITINSPSTPLELHNALFCSTAEPIAAVFQQELIVACSDLISQSAEAFNGVLTIRLAWMADAIGMLVGFIKEDIQRRKKRLQSSKGSGDEEEEVRPPYDLVSFLESSCPASVVKQFKAGNNIGVYDLPPTVIKNLLAALMMRKDIWNFLSPLQIKKLNGALNRVPINLYDRVWKILERVKQGIIISGHVLPQFPTLHVMTQHELNFSYKLESMMGDIAYPEYRQIIVELLCIVATMMERNPEIHIVGALDCDALVKQAFNLFCEERRIKDRVDMTPFYDDDLTGAPTCAYLIRVVVDKLLKDANIRHFISTANEKNFNFNRREDDCSIM